MRSKAIVCAMGLGFGTPILADSDGALPRGKGATPGKKVSERNTQAQAFVDCSSYLLSGYPGNLLFSQNGQFTYFLSRDKDDTSPYPKSYLYEVDLANYRFKRIVSLRVGAQAALVGHGKPIEAISVFDLRQGPSHCGEGVSAGIGISWVKNQKTIQSFPSLAIKVLPSSEGPLVADLKAKSIKGVDPDSFQKRTLANFSAEVIPLYLKVSPPVLYGYSKEKNELLRFEKNSIDPVASMVLAKDMRLVQQGEVFAVFKGDDATRKYQFKMIKAWTGEKFQSFDLSIPQPWTSQNMAIGYSYDTGVLAIYGATSAVQRELKQVLIYSLFRNAVERVLNAAPGQYLSQVTIDPKGKQLVILSRTLEHDDVQSMRIVSLNNGESREVNLVQDAEVKIETLVPEFEEKK